MDGDDYVSPDMIQALHDYLVEKKYDILMCSYFTDNKDQIIERSFFERTRDFQEDDIGDLIRICCGIEKDIEIRSGSQVTNIGVPWAKLYRREFVDKHSLRFVPGLKRMQDTVFTISALNMCPCIGYLSKPLYYYVCRNDSAIHRYTTDFHLTADDILKNLLIKLKDSKYVSDVECVMNFKAISLFVEMMDLEYLNNDNPDPVRQKVGELRKKVRKLFIKLRFPRKSTGILRTIRNCSRLVFDSNGTVWHTACS